MNVVDAGCIGPSTRLYFETLGEMPGTSREPADLINRYCGVPTAVAMFPKEIIRFPRSWSVQSTSKLSTIKIVISDIHECNLLDETIFMFTSRL